MKRHKLFKLNKKAYFSKRHKDYTRYIRDLHQYFYYLSGIYGYVD